MEETGGLRTLQRRKVWDTIVFLEFSSNFRKNHEISKEEIFLTKILQNAVHCQVIFYRQKKKK